MIKPCQRHLLLDGMHCCGVIKEVFTEKIALTYGLFEAETGGVCVLVLDIFDDIIFSWRGHDA